MTDVCIYFDRMTKIQRRSGASHSATQPGGRLWLPELGCQCCARGSIHNSLTRQVPLPLQIFSPHLPTLYLMYSPSTCNSLPLRLPSILLDPNPKPPSASPHTPTSILTTKCLIRKASMYLDPSLSSPIRRAWV